MEKIAEILIYRENDGIINLNVLKALKQAGFAVFSLKEYSDISVCGVYVSPDETRIS